MTDRIVIVGAGQAGAALAAKLRALGHAGAITLIGGEKAPPYQRPPLSKKYLLGEMSVDRLHLKPGSFYTENAIDLRTGLTVTGIDRSGRTVLTDAGPVPYDALALTTGAIPRRLPAAIGGVLPGVHVVRSLADVDAMASDVIPGRRMLVVGGGYIGLEAAAVARTRGLDVTLVEVAPRILNRVASAETAALVRDLHADQGVDIRESVGLETLSAATPGGPVSQARLTDGTTLPADIVVVGIGVVPDTTLAEAAGLHLDNGIATDGSGRTSDPAIFAAGDCASFPWRDGRIRLESVQNAIDQAEHVAAAMLGSDAAYIPEPWFWSDQFDAKLQIAGLNTGNDRVIQRPGHRPGGASVWYFAGDAFLAVDALNDPKAYMQGKRWLSQGATLDPNRLADPETPLSSCVST